jgi:Bacterial Ig-like domain (group 2)
MELAHGQSVDLTVAYTDSQGAPAHPPGPVNWTSSAESIATVSAGTDDTQATVVSVANGTATITAESNGIACGIDIIVGAGESAASEGEITAGEPYDTTGTPVQPLPEAGPGWLPGRQPGQRPGQQAPVRPGQPIVRTTTIRR